MVLLPRLFNLVFIVPAVYTVAVMAHIFWQGLLPTSGKRRQLSIFLIRIIFLYFIVFMPVAISVLVGNFVYFESNWRYYVPTVMTHLQGILTTLLCYCTNREVADSMKKVLQCNWSNDDETPSSRNSLNVLDEERAGVSCWLHWKLFGSLMSQNFRSQTMNGVERSAACDDHEEEQQQEEHDKAQQEEEDEEEEIMFHG